MRNILTKILLTSIILLWLWNINGANAGDLDWFESIFNQQEEFSCITIEREITHYPRYKWIIDNYFRKISTKSYTYKKRIYIWLNDLTDRKLTTINRGTQVRLYAIVWYLKCESNKKLDKLYLNIGLL